MQQKPPVLFYLKLYSVGMAFLYLALILLFGWVISMDSESADDLVAPIMMLVIGAMCFGFALFHGTAMLINRQPWGYALGMGIIVVGLTSCATWPFTIPMLMMWMKPETKAWFRPETVSDVFR